MSGLKSFMMMAASMAAMGEGGAAKERKTRKPTQEELEEFEKKKKEKEIERNEKRGLKRFYYGENFVWALNEKNANKKAKRKGFL